MAAGERLLHGRYRIDRPIGHGGFAEVFLATDLVLKRAVAVKLLKTALIEREGELDFLARFAAEAQAVAVTKTEGAMVSASCGFMPPACHTRPLAGKALD